MVKHLVWTILVQNCSKPALQSRLEPASEYLQSDSQSVLSHLTGGEPSWTKYQRKVIHLFVTVTEDILTFSTIQGLQPNASDEDAGRSQEEITARIGCLQQRRGIN